VPKKYVEEGRRRRLQEGADRRPGPTVSSAPRQALKIVTWRPSRATGGRCPASSGLVFKSVPTRRRGPAALQRRDADIVYFLGGPVAERHPADARPQAHRRPDEQPSSSSTSPSSGTRSLPGTTGGSSRREPRDRPEDLERGRTARLRWHHREHRATPHGVSRCRFDPHPYDPKRAKQLPDRGRLPERLRRLATFTPNPPYFFDGG